MRKLDKIIVIDLEATCWEGDPPAGETSEIIEIGLCVLDVASGEREPARALLVKPHYSTLSPYCQKLTSITPEMLEDGLDLADACAVLQDEYLSETRTWASFGDYDRMMLQSQCEARGIPYPFGRSHINVKNLLALQKNLQHEVNLHEATAMLGLTFEGTIHRGMDDAWNIAAVLDKVLLKRNSQTEATV